MAKKDCKPIKHIVTAEMKAVIAEAVEAGRQAGRTQTERDALDPYKATEKRLYAYPVLSEKVKSDKEKLARMATHGTPERSRGIARYSRPGYRQSPEELLDAVIQEEAARLIADEEELKEIREALATIKNDEYYEIIPNWYFRDLTKEEIAKRLNCDGTTVWRHKKRLINRIVVRLYGSITLK